MTDDTINLRIKLAHRCLEMFKESLEPWQWEQCTSGQDDPDSFCDSNMIMDAAYEEVFGFSPDAFFGRPEEPEVFSHWNAAVRLATPLMLGKTFTDEEAAAIVKDDNPVGLQIVGGGKRLREVAREYGLIR